MSERGISGRGVLDGPSRSIVAMIGKRKPAVLPEPVNEAEEASVPVCAQAMRSRFAVPMAMPYF